MATYYVSALIGNDNNAGTSATSPVETLQGDVPLAVEIWRSGRCQVAMLGGQDIGFKPALVGILTLMGSESGSEQRELLARLQSSEALGRFLHRSCGPAQRHRGIAPAFDVAADPTDGAHHVLDDVGAG